MSDNERADLLTGVIRGGSSYAGYHYDGASSINMQSAGDSPY